MNSSRTLRSILALASAIALAGFTDCRFGNRVEYAAQREEIGGYYLTEARALSYCATLGESEDCVVANISQIPSEIRAIFTNPIGFLLDEATGDAAIINPFDPSSNPPSLGTWLDVNRLTIKSRRSSNPERPLPITLSDWLPSGFRQCGLILQIDQEGRLSSVDRGVELYGARMKGRLVLELTVSRTLSGPECANTLTLLENCFLDHSECLGTGEAQNRARQAEVAQIFAPYLEHQVIEGSQIGSLKAFSYRVRYE